MVLKEATKFEKAVVEHILRKEGCEFKGHLSFLKVEKRENTGVGIYVYFKYLEDLPPGPIKSETLGKFVYAEIEGLEGGAGFMLYIDEGRITLLECFSHSSKPWPSHILKFYIQDL